MKKIGIITIISYNFGNRLQNYALQYYLTKNYSIEVETVLNNGLRNTKRFYFLRKIKNKIFKSTDNFNNDCFLKFDEYINFSSNEITAYRWLNDEYDYFISGSDQVWNPKIDRLREVDCLAGIKNHKRISYAASFGVSYIPQKYEKNIKKYIKNFKSISVRENSGKKIIEELTGRTDVEVLIDPTMLLTPDDWDRVSNKPCQINKFNGKKYILNYFLGDISCEVKNEIERFAKDNNCEIVNLLEKNDPFYGVGPSEFLYLEKHAFLICTDSFHSSVFALLYNKPFVIFERKNTGSDSMYSRLDTLIEKFKLKYRKYNGKEITKENINHDYTEAYRILNREREKSDKFLRKALDIDN